MSRRQEVPPRLRELAAQLAMPRPMRRGSLSERYVKCSKPGCKYLGLRWTNRSMPVR